MKKLLIKQKNSKNEFEKKFYCHNGTIENTILNKI